MQTINLSEGPLSHKPVSCLWLLALAGCFSSTHAEILFEDVTTSAGFPATGSESWGSAWGDINGDDYPDVYSSNHRTPASLFRNNKDGTFSDVSKEVDLSGTEGWTGDPPDKDTHGAIWGDVDNDGDDDLYLSISNDSDRLLINNGGLLTDRSADWQVDQLSHSNARMSLFLDYTGDGRLDIMAAALENPRLYPQQEDNTFGYSSLYRVELDCNDDASFAHMADVYAGSDGVELLCGPRNGVYPENIYSWTAGNVTDTNNNFPATGRVNDAIVADFDGDLRPDVYEVISTAHPSGVTQVGNKKLETQLVTTRNNVKSAYFTTTGILTVTADLRAGDPREGDPAFIDIGATGYSFSSLTFTLDPSNPDNQGIQTSSAGINIGFNSETSTWQIRQGSGEYNYSYVIVESTQPITNVYFEGLTSADKPGRNKLLMNHPSGWADETVARGLGDEVLCFTGVAGDFDNDMDQDIFLGCNGGSENIANIMYENQGDGTFVALPNGAGAAGYVGGSVLDNAGTTESVITADYDIDGFLDLFVTNGNNLRPTGHGGPKQLFHNQGNGNNWIEIDLIGVADNRDGVGATLLVTAGGVTQYLEQNGKYHRWSQSHKRMHIGLGSNATASVVIHWPNGDTDEYTDVAANQLYSATQNSSLDINQVTRDSDGDGLSDEREAELGTNPSKADTDGDTMDDLWEVQQGTNPVRRDGAKDPDKDKLTNRQEFRFGTDPRNADTDGDKLRDNVEVRKWSTDPLDTDTDDDGLKDRREVIFLKTNPLSGDTDGDTMPDKWEVNFGLNPVQRDGAKDKDNDDLTNRQEFIYGTEPNNPDTDGGGTNDGTEINAGTNPFNPADD